MMTETLKKHFLDWKQELLECRSFLLHFLRYPVQQIKHLPDWSWKRLISLHVFITGITGFLGGFFDKRDFFSPIVGVFITPILTLISLSVASFFFYHAFQIFAQKVVSFRRLFTILLFAHIPSFILNTVAGYVPPVYIVGFSFSALLMVVGFVENFQLERKFIIKLIASIYAIFILLWIYGRIQSFQEEKRYQSSPTYDTPRVELGK